MKSFKTVLIPVPASDVARRLPDLEILLGISEWIGGDTHILIHGDPEIPLDQECLSALSKSTGAGSVAIHRGKGNPTEFVLNLIRTYSIDLMLMNTCPAEPFAISWMDRDILRQTDIPALLVPKGMTTSGIPTSLLVPFSAEPQSSRALDLAIHVSNERDLPLDLVHVTHEDNTCNCEGAVLEHFGDQFHYEYPKLLEGILAKASPFTTPAERRCVREFRHSHGELSHEIAETMKKAPGAWLVFEWRGSMAPGRARIIKQGLRLYRYPILLVHSAQKKLFRLKIGPYFEAA